MVLIRNILTIIAVILEVVKGAIFLLPKLIRMIKELIKRRREEKMVRATVEDFKRTVKERLEARKNKKEST